MERRRLGGTERGLPAFFLTVRGGKVAANGGLRCRLTDVVLEGSAPTSSPVDPWQIHIIAPIMVKVFLGVSDSGHRVCMEEILPNRVPEVDSKIAVSTEPLGRGLTSQL